MQIKTILSLVAAIGLATAVTAANGAALPKGDPARGEKLYQECRGCHAYKETLVGPPHCGVYGRRAGSVEGYDYSEAMKKSGIIWNEQTLDAYLKSPDSLVPGVNMTAPPIDNPQDRADIIAYLKAGLDPDICGPANANPAK